MRRPAFTLALAASAFALNGHMPAPPAQAPAKAAPADRPSAAETARISRNFVEAAGRSLGARSGDLFALPHKYRYIIEGTYIKRTVSHVAKDGREAELVHFGNHHGTAWDYDVRIPLLVWGPSYAKAGYVSHGAATQQDIVPTIAHVLGAVPPEDAAGRPLLEALKPAKKAPKVVLVLVFDQGGRSMLDAHPGKTPFISSLKAQGAWFEQARVTHMDPETIVGHTAIGTGAYPGRNGITANKPWIRSLGAARMAVLGDKGPTPAAIESPSLADAWLRQTGGKAVVIGQSLADRAAIGMVGHGALYEGNPKPICHWYDEKKGVWATNPDAFAQPDYVRDIRPEPYWRAAGGHEGRWRGHRFDNFVDFKISPAGAAFDGDTMMAMLEREPVGRDETPDLVFWSLKATDYVAHRYGLETLEERDALAAADAQAKRAFDLLADRVGRDRLMVVFSADHGGGPLPELHGGARMAEGALIEMINRRFDRVNPKTPLALHVTSTQVYLDDAELRANKVTPEMVRDYLRTIKPDGRPFFAAVYTRKEIEAARR